MLLRSVDRREEGEASELRETRRLRQGRDARLRQLPLLQPERHALLPVRGGARDVLRSEAEEPAREDLSRLGRHRLAKRRRSGGGSVAVAPNHITLPSRLSFVLCCEAEEVK